MLDFFRQKGLTSIIYGVIIVGMILVFVLGFNPSAGKKLGTVSEACAARVHGSCIEPKAHRAAYRLVFSRGTGRMKQATASRIVLEGLIERELLVTEAQRLGLTVSEDEITDSIFHGYVMVSLPSDQVQMQQGLGLNDGRVNVGFKDPKTKQFDMKTYERMVKQITGRSPTEFREWQSREILAGEDARSRSRARPRRRGRGARPLQGRAHDRDGQLRRRPPQLAREVRDLYGPEGRRHLGQGQGQSRIDQGPRPPHPREVHGREAGREGSLEGEGPGHPRPREEGRRLRASSRRSSPRTPAARTRAVSIPARWSSSSSSRSRRPSSR